MNTTTSSSRKNVKIAWEWRDIDQRYRRRRPIFFWRTYVLLLSAKMSLLVGIMCPMAKKNHDMSRSRIDKL